LQNGLFRLWRLDAARPALNFALFLNAAQDKVKIVADTSALGGTFGVAVNVGLVWLAWRQLGFAVVLGTALGQLVNFAARLRHAIVALVRPYFASLF